MRTKTSESGADPGARGQVPVIQWLEIALDLHANAMKHSRGARRPSQIRLDGTGGDPGLLDEYFDFTNSLSAIPDLSGLTPDVSRVELQPGPFPPHPPLRPSPLVRTLRR